MNTQLNTGFSDGSLTQADILPMEACPDLLSLLTDVLGHGIIVVSEQGHILHANRVASAELKRCRVLEKTGSKIHALSPAAGKVLQSALNKAACGKRSLINVSCDAMGLTLAVVPLQAGAEIWDTRIALFFERAEVCESGMFGFFARSFGLTQTEEQVLAILCRGLSTPEIALQMKVAVSTVRSHVRSLCAKTGSRGVRELVNRVAVLPPVAPLPQAQIH